MRASLLAGSIALLALDQAALAETPEQQAEKDARRACEAKICDIVATRNQVGEDVTCDIVKTWDKDEIVEALGDHVNWPWGSATCQTKVTLERKAIAKTASEPAYAMTIPVQTMRCELAQGADGDPYVVQFSAAPKLKFENGKAIAAQVNWGKASAPALVYPLIYAGTAFDNSTNIFGPEVVRLVNDFTAKRCNLVKAALPPASQN